MTEASSVAKRLKAIRERANMSVRQLASAAGRSSSTYAWYEDNFKKPFLPFDLVRDIEPALVAKGIAKDELYELAGLQPASSVATQREPDHPPAYVGTLQTGYLDVGATEFVSIGRYDASLSAGPGSLIDDDPEPLGFHLMESQWLRTVTNTAPAGLAIVRVDGNSMEGTLQDGDWVLVDITQRKFGREGIYALNVYGQAWIKRLSVNLGKKLIQIISDNTIYPMQELDEGEIQLIGRVVSLVLRPLR